jgi:2-polyprenyl-3-methyl-5-hydroxy-6-metoxy-1,4-benzoquinol methylase
VEQGKALGLTRSCCAAFHFVLLLPQHAMSSKLKATKRKYVAEAAEDEKNELIITGTIHDFSLHSSIYPGATVYGEIKWNSIKSKLIPHLLQHNLINSESRWLDFGSGIGNICLCLAWLGYRVHGIENEPNRFLAAQKLFDQLAAKQQLKPVLDRIHMKLADFFDLSASDDMICSEIIFSYDVWMNKKSSVQLKYANKIKQFPNANIVISGLNRNKDFISVMGSIGYFLHSSVNLLAEGNIIQKFNIFVKEAATACNNSSNTKNPLEKENAHRRPKHSK